MLGKKIPLQNFDHFLSKFSNIMLTYKFMRYSVIHTYNFLKGEYKIDPTDKETDMPAGTYITQVKEGYPLVIHSYSDLLNLINEYADADKQPVFGGMLRHSGQLIRISVINSSFEMIQNYIYGIKKDQSVVLRDLLHKQPWFKVLNLLRNNASHFDNSGKKLDRKENRYPYYIKEKEVKWNNIVITEGMMGHELRYNDEELQLLLEEALDYFLANEAIFK